MRTNIDIDERLMTQAMRRSGARTKKAAVEAGLRLLAQTHAQGSIRRLRGKVDWDGRTLREQGYTVRTTIDCLIATFCLEAGHELLHRDRDFDVFERALGLRVVHP